MRVAFVTGGLKLGGSTTFLCNICGELLQRGIPTQILSFEKDNPLKSDFDNLQIPVSAMDGNRMIFEDRIRTGYKALHDFRPTVVLANLGSVSFEMLRYVPEGVFRIGIGHSDHPNVYQMIRNYASTMDALGVVSITMKRTFETFPELKTSVYYLPLGVHIPKELHRSYNTGNSLRILYLGRVEQEQKRVHLFPQIFEELKASGIPFHWTIAGDGPEKQRLENTMKSSPHQSVSFPGTIPYKQVPELLDAHDILILASDHEGLPLTLLEAMGAGLVPVVSHLPSGIPDVVNSDSGILVAADDIPGYARAIVHLHHHREDLIEKGISARKRVERGFSIAAMTERWLSIIPKASLPTDIWPAKTTVQPPLGAAHKSHFSPWFRTIRRLVVKFRR